MGKDMTPPPVPSQPPVGTTGKKPLWKKKRFIIPVAIIALFLIFAACSTVGRNQSGSGNPSAVSPTASPSEIAASPPADAPPPAPAPPPPPAEPQGTAGQLQALAAAKGYLASGIGFSQASLTAQLTSSYGNGFTPADAEWAIANSDADWNEQALKAAKGYLNSGIGFSQASLAKQLTSSSGNQFTTEQADYAVANSGADWNEQAVKAAQGYMKSGIGFSRQGLISQLTSEFGNQFTQEQAEFAAGQVGL